MLEQLGKPIKFIAFLSLNDGAGAANVQVRVSVYNPHGLKIIDNEIASEVGDGFYNYELDGSMTTIIGEYMALFRTNDARVAVKHIPSLWIVGRGGVENLDVKVSSRIAGGIPQEEEPPQGTPRSWTYRLTLPDGVTPITSANIWVSSDPGGIYVVASGMTNHRGEITFVLIPDTIYVWRRKAGYRFDNPDKKVIL